MALIDDDVLASCPYGPVFARALFGWARELQSAHNHAHADSSMTELQEATEVVTHVSKSEQTFGEAKTLGRNIPRCSW